MTPTLTPNPDLECFELVVGDVVERMDPIRLVSVRVRVGIRVGVRVGVEVRVRVMVGAAVRVKVIRYAMKAEMP